MKRAFLNKTILLGTTVLLGTTLSLQAFADQRLAMAAMERDLDTVRQLLAEKGADVNAPGPYNTPALHWLVRIEAHDLVQRLLDAGADPNLLTDLGLSALNLAIENKDEAMVRLLLANGAQVNAPDWTGETPLMHGARSGSSAIVESLLEHGAEANVREPIDEQTPLMFGVRSGSAEVVALLLAAGAEVNVQSKPGEVPRFRLASENAGSKGVGVTRGGWPERGQRAPIGGAKTPLLYATRQGDLETTKLLVAAGADLEHPDANGVTPLINAIINASVANQGRNSKHIEVARFLIEQGANIKARDWYGQTPLWAAVDLRNLDVSGPTRDNGIDRAAAFSLIETLLEHGADPNARTEEVPPEHRWITRLGSLSWVDFTGQTPFLRAALAGDVATMKLLVAHGADPNIHTYAGTTPLMAAAGVNWTVSQTFDEGQEALLEAVTLAHALGNDVNAQNAQGFTAIHGAANRGSNEIIRWLAANGAKLDVEDAVGRNAIAWAHGVFLATHPPVDKPDTVKLLEELLLQQQAQQQAQTSASTQ